MSSNKRILTAGSIATLNLVFGSGVTSGKSMALAYGTENLQFYFTSPQDDSGLQLPPFSNTAEYDSFVAALEANYYINRDYDVIKVNDVAPFEIALQAKENGTEYSIDTADVTNCVQSKVVVAGVDTVYAQNFTPICEVYVDQGSGMELVSTIDAGFLADDSFKFHIHGILKDYISADLPAVDFPGVAIDRYISSQAKSLLKYYLKFFERYGDPPMNKLPVFSGTEAAPKLAVDFGVPFEEYPGNDNQNLYFTDLADRKFLTNYDIQKIVSPQGIDYLSIFTNDVVTGSAKLWLYADYYFTDATTALNTLIADSDATISFGDKSKIFEFAVLGDEIYNHTVTTGKTIDYVEIYAKSGYDFSTSEKIKFYFDSQAYEKNTWFLYKNRFGGWEVFWATGHIKQQKEYTRIQAQLEAKDDYSESDYEVFTYNHNYTDVFEINTGIKTADELAKLSHLVDAEYVYILDGPISDQHSVWRRIIVDSKKYKAVESSYAPEDLYRVVLFKNAFESY